MTRQAILVYGNCQADAISACLRRLPVVAERYDVVSIPSYIHPIDGPPRIAPADLDRCAVLLEQRALWHRFPALARMSPSVIHLDFPMLALNAVWPLQAKEFRNRCEPDFPFGRYPYGDRVLNGLLTELAGEDVLQRYLATPLASLPDPRRFAAIEAERVAALDRQCTLAFGGWVLDHFRTRRLFWTYNHPTAALLQPLAEALTERLAGALALPKTIVDDIGPLFATGWEPAGRLKVAIHPNIARGLNLEWFSPAFLYDHYQHSGVGYVEYWRHQISFD